MGDRCDGRNYDELRQIKITPNFLNHRDGSVLIECGGTKVICAVTIEPGVPGWMRSQNVPGGWVTSEYGMLPAATHDRTRREAKSGKQSGRTMEIQRLIGRSFRAVVDLMKLKANTVYIDCDVMDADGGTRCASITGASVALYMAFENMVKRGALNENPMHGLAGAVSVGVVDGKPSLDLCYKEDSSADVDMNIVMTDTGRFIEIQGTAEETPFTMDEMQAMLGLAQKGLGEIFDIQRSLLAECGIEKKTKDDGSLGAALSQVGL